MIMSKSKPRWERVILALVAVLIIGNRFSRPFRGANPTYEISEVVDVLLNALVFDLGFFGLGFWILIAFCIGQAWQKFRTPNLEKQRDEFFCKNCKEMCPDRDAYIVNSETTNEEEWWCPHCVLDSNLTVNTASSS